MGQAKRRGSFEQRRSSAIIRNQSEKERRIKDDMQRIEAMTPAEKRRRQMIALELACFSQMFSSQMFSYSRKRR